MQEFLNRVLYGNCAEIMAYMPSESVDLTVTSPPYDDIRDYNGYDFNFEEIAKQLYRITKDGGVVVWVVADKTENGSETGESFRQALYFKEIGFNLHDTMVWNKGVAPFQHKNRYINSFEYMFVFSKGKPKTHNIIKDRKNKRAGTQVHGTDRQKNGETKPRSEVQKSKQVKEYGSRLNIWELPPNKTNKTIHPATFPEQLANDHVVTWSNEGDIVFDPMCGSGTTLKMAHLNNRKFVGIDTSIEYVELTRKRLATVRKNAE